MNLKILFLAMGAALTPAILPAPALAQQASAEQIDKAKQMFAKTDANGDGRLSLAEWKDAGRRERGFAMIDGNTDGYVTPEEIRSFAAARKGGN